jgi:hypothetical protein
LRCSAIASQIDPVRLHREIMKTRCRRLLYAAAGRGHEGLTLPCMHGAYVCMYVQARRSGQEHGAVMFAYTYMMQARPRQRACLHVQATHGRIYVQVPDALKVSRSTALRRKSSPTTTTPVPLHEQVLQHTPTMLPRKSETIQATPSMQVLL